MSAGRHLVARTAVLCRIGASQESGPKQCLRVQINADRTGTLPRVVREGATPDIQTVDAAIRKLFKPWSVLGACSIAKHRWG